MIYAEYQSSATLECLVEAFPEAIRYWDGVGNGATCRVCKCPGRQSLTLVYIYLGALTLILASLSIVFYTHTQDVESLSQVEDNYSSKSFRVQFQAELMRSEEELRRLVNRIIEEEQELVGRWADH